MERRQPPRSPHAQENANAQKTLTKMATKLLPCPMVQEHAIILAHAHI